MIGDPSDADMSDQRPKCLFGDLIFLQSIKCINSAGMSVSNQT